MGSALMNIPVSIEPPGSRTRTGGEASPGRLRATGSLIALNDTIYALQRAAVGSK